MYVAYQQVCMHSWHRGIAYLFYRKSWFVHIDLLSPNGLYCRVWETWSFAMNSCLWRIRLISCQRYSLLETRWLTLIQGVNRWKSSITSMSSHDVRASMYHANSRYVMYPTYLHIEISLIFWSKRYVVLPLSIILTQVQNFDFHSTANNLEWCTMLPQRD